MARFAETVNIRKVDPSSGFIQQSNSLLSRLESFSSQATAVSSQIAAQKGQAEAQQVELTKEDGITQAPKRREASLGETLLTGGITTRQYNKSLETAYLASLGTDVNEGINALANENPDNIIAFNEKVAGFAKGVLQGVDPAMRQQVTQFLDSKISSSRNRVHANTIKKNKSEARAINSTAVTDFSNEASSAARLGDTQSSEEFQILAYETINGMVEAGEMASDRASILKREITRESFEQTKRKGFDDTIEKDGTEKAQQDLNKLIGKPPRGWTPDEWDTYTDSQQVDINRAVSKNRAQKQEVNNDAKIALKQYASAKGLGFEVSPQEQLRVKELVAGNPEQVLFDRINKTAAFSVMGIQDRNRALNEIQTGDLANVDDFASLIKANNDINRMATDDGYSLGVSQGLIQEVTFNPSDPLSLSLKADQAEGLSIHYGVNVSPLTNFEAENLSKSIEEMTVQEKVSLSDTLNRAPEVWGQVSEKNQQVFSMAGATGDNVLMAAVFQGQELIKAKLVSAPKGTDYLPVSDEFLSDVYGIQDKSAIVEAAKAHYAATVGNVDVFDVDGFEDSLAAVTGGIAEVNGNKLELPRGVIDDDFEDFIDEFSADNVNKMGGVLGFTDIEAANIINDAKIKSIGANKYIILTGETQALFGADGNPFVISFTEEVKAEQDAARFMKTKTIESAIKKIRSF